MTSQSLKLDRVRKAVLARATIIGAPQGLLPTFGLSEDTARPHVEVLGSSYRYVVQERGIELSSQTTESLDDLLFWIFDDLTFQMGIAWELAHRIEGRDSRRMIFERQLELLEVLEPRWAARDRRQNQKWHAEARVPPVDEHDAPWSAKNV